MVLARVGFSNAAANYITTDDQLLMMLCKSKGWLIRMLVDSTCSFNMESVSTRLTGR